MVLQLFANPRCTVHVGNSLTRLAKLEPISFSAQQSSRRCMVLVRDRDVLMVQILVVKVDHLELFPRLVRSLAWRRQWSPFLPAPAPFLFHLLPTFLFLRLRDDRHYDTIAAGINPCFS